jgi:hypothetical protein
MLTSLFVSLSLVSTTMEQNKQDAPAPQKELFAKEEWYKTREGKEAEFTGVLKYTPRKEGVIGFNRFNPYRLEMGEKFGVREVHVAGDEKILAEYHGKKVKIVGKAVEMEVEGKMHKEIWPARVELIDEKDSKK